MLALSPRRDQNKARGFEPGPAHDSIGHAAEGVAACEGRTGACGNGNGSTAVAILVHGAGEPVRRAQVGGALPVDDHRALGRRDDLSRSRGSLGGEDLRSIPVAAKAGGRRLLLRPRVAGRDVPESPARRLHGMEEGPEQAGIERQLSLRKHR